MVEEAQQPLSEYYRHISKGAWPFSTRDHGWPISDCSSEGLKAALVLAQVRIAFVCALCALRVGAYTLRSHTPRLCSVVATHPPPFVHLPGLAADGSQAGGPPHPGAPAVRLRQRGAVVPEWGWRVGYVRKQALV